MKIGFCAGPERIAEVRDAGFDAVHTGTLNRTALLKALLHQSANLTGLEAPGLEPAFSPTVYEYTADGLDGVKVSLPEGATAETVREEGLCITVTSPFEDPYTETGAVQNVYKINVR